jgi:hypothetical protein
VAAEIFLVGAVLVVAVLLGRWLSIRLESAGSGGVRGAGRAGRLLSGMAEIQLSRTSCCCCSCPR